MDVTGLGAVADAAKGIIGMFFPDKTEEEKAKLAASLALIQGQMDVNKNEAMNPSIFVAGWRPFVGWICGSGFGIQFVIGPVLEWGAALAGHPIAFPKMDLSTMMPLLLGMLGLGGMRTAEKIQGVSSGH
jgi:hypothetical protein